MYHQLTKWVVFYQLLHGLSFIDSWPESTKKKAFRFPTVILISFDGFRWDYLDRLNLKNFKYIMENGVRANSLESSFVTKTFPNHFTLVTGLHEESHGILGSKMYDPLYNETFNSSTTDPKWWNATTPIWIKNELASNATVARKSATIFWVGSNVKYNGKLPYYYKPVYNSSFSSEDRFRLVIKLLKEKEPPNFLACYIDEPDRTAHRYGPESEQVNSTLRSIDNLLGKFLETMRTEGFLKHVNIVVVSDHGMTSIEPQNQIVLDNFIDRSWYNPIEVNVYATLIPTKNYTSKLYSKLKGIPHLTTYMKHEIPNDLHYKNHRRVPQIFAIADEGFIIKQSKENINHTIGNHGYFEKLKSMHGIFLAMGPAFKRGYVGETFRNIHIYEMLCHILEITPSPNNGSLLDIKQFLANSTHTQSIEHKNVLLKVIVLCTILFLILTSIGCYLQCRKHSSRSDGYVKLSRESVSLELLTADLVLQNSSDEDEI